MSIRCATQNGTASSASDFFSANVVLTFSPGSTRQTVIVLVRGDTLTETNETFSVNLSSPVNVIVGRSPGTGKILDDDFRVAAVEVAGADIRIRFGRYYRIERTDRLTGNITWTAVSGAENVRGTGSLVEALHTGPAVATQRFYRVKLLP